MSKKIEESKIIKAGVIGVGHLGAFHAEKYAKLDLVELVGVYDLDLNRAREIAEKLSVPAFDDIDKLFSLCHVVSIAAPTSAHFKLAQKALLQGLDILVEKPITTTEAEAEILIKLAQEHKSILQVGLLERYNPAFTKTRDLLVSPRFIEVHRLSPFSFRSVDIDVILDLMIHDLDLVHEITKSPIISIDAVGVPVISKKTDIANVRIHFASGTVANLTASRVSLNPERRIRIFQPDSYFSLDFGNFTATVCTRKEGTYIEPLPKITTKELTFPKSDNLLLEIEDFIDAVRHRRKPIISGDEGLLALSTATRIKEKIEEQQHTWIDF
ncbi:MAG: Gfo/Idh/MocA family oxidoreductase [Deltaproteobacteria bacterium]|nr:Gfo/Idh/MocA family oxidoreductase [Candidatus Tharpella aukensis]